MIDILDMLDDPLPGVLLHFDESNISDVFLCVVGPEGTPYEGGFFPFHVRFGTRYPSEPPSVTFLTPNEQVRFHPNLYQNGKVCLSILGTWSGPQWTSVMNLRSLSLSLQSILCPHPLRNEPGLEMEPVDSRKNMVFNTCVRYACLRHALLETVSSGNHVPAPLKAMMNDYVKDHIPVYAGLYDYVNERRSSLPESLRTVYGIKLLVDYKSLRESWLLVSALPPSSAA